MHKSELPSRYPATEPIASRANPRSNRERRLRTCKAAVLRTERQKYSRSCTGLCSGTLPLVKSMLHRTSGVSIPSPSVELVRTDGVSKQIRKQVSACKSGFGGTFASKMVAAQTSTPNPSIEGMPKRLRLLRPPHVKR
jgi:hypothetical protein